MVVLKVAAMVIVGVLSGCGRRRLNQLAVRTWPSPKPRFRSTNARIASASTVFIATCVSLAVGLFLHAPEWSFYVSAALFIVIGEQKNFA